MKVSVVQSRPTFCYPMNCVACQAPLSMEFSRQEYWTGLPFPSLGDSPHSGMEPGSPALQADSLPSATREAASQIQESSLPRGHASLPCIVPILVYICC